MCWEQEERGEGDGKAEAFDDAAAIPQHQGQALLRR